MYQKLWWKLHMFTSIQESVSESDGLQYPDFPLTGAKPSLIWSDVVLVSNSDETAMACT